MPAGNTTTLRQPDTLIRAVDQQVELLSWTNFPFLAHLTSGSLDANPKITALDAQLDLRDSVLSDKISYYTRDLPPIAFELAATINNAVTTFNLTPAADAAHFQVGLMFDIDDETFLVNAAGNESTGAVGVERAYAGSAAAAHTATSGTKTIFIQALGLGENADAPAGNYTDATELYNYWMGITESFGASLYNRSVGRYDTADDPLVTQEADKMITALQRLEQVLLYGKRFKSPNSQKPSMFGGFNSVIPATNKVTLATALTTADVDTLMRKMSQQGGVRNTPDTLVTSYLGWEVLTKLYYGSTYNVNLTRAETETVAGVQFSEIRTNTGILKIVPCTSIRNEKEMYLYRRETVKVGFANIKDNGNGKSYGLGIHEKPVAGPRTERYLYGVFSAAYKRPTAIGKISWV